MEKFNQILRNVLIFTAVYLIISYVFQSCQGKQDIALNSGNVYFSTSDTEYSRRQVVTLEIENTTSSPLIIPNECPGEPFEVYRYENNTWVQKVANPELNGGCPTAKETTIESGKKLKIPYVNWNNALFSEMGRFRIEFKTNLDGKDTILTSNEFTIVKEGLFRQVWIGLFHRPIYNGLIFLISIAPMRDLGFAIIILTILIRTILLLPSHRSMKAQRKMQELQPKLNKIKEKHKGNQQQIALETMALYKEAKVSPVSGCLPVLLQLPFLIALYHVIQGGLNPDNIYLLYGSLKDFDLHNIHTNFLGVLELTKINTYVMPLIIGGLQFIQMKLSMSFNTKKHEDKDAPKNEMAMANNMMIYTLPVMTAVFTAILPAGVALYWGTSTIYGIVQQLFINKAKQSASNNEPQVKVIEHKSNP